VTSGLVSFAIFFDSRCEEDLYEDVIMTMIMVHAGVVDVVFDRFLIVEDCYYFNGWHSHQFSHVFSYERLSVGKIYLLRRIWNCKQTSEYISQEMKKFILI
jgi:hypothetical protein